MIHQLRTNTKNKLPQKNTIIFGKKMVYGRFGNLILGENFRLLFEKEFRVTNLLRKKNICRIIIIETIYDNVFSFGNLKIAILFLGEYHIDISFCIHGCVDTYMSVFVFRVWRGLCFCLCTSINVCVRV